MVYNDPRLEAFAVMMGKRATPVDRYLHIVQLPQTEEQNGVCFDYKVVCNKEDALQPVLCRDLKDANNMAVYLSNKTGIKIRREGFDKLRDIQI